MYALCDANTFFASVERVFHPGLKGKPVCVLSSNDGIIVALTAEAKAIGLHRGDPVFKVQEIIRRHDVAVFSTNMMLYNAMSQRIVSILRQSVEQVEVYSVDESFMNLAGYEDHYDLVEFMREIADRIRTWTDIPVSVGIAKTKTLAKIASKFAKKYPGYHSVCSINTEEQRRKALSMFDLADVWGIGRRTLEKLQSLGITTPLQFADMDGRWVKRYFTKPGIQTWMELNGYPCIDTSEVAQRQQICTSRSFGEMVTALDYLRASVATFAASCANKLRGQGSVAKSVTVFLCSNYFRKDLPQYFSSASFDFHVATSDTLEITSAAMKILEGIYCPGIFYKKSGVILGDISSEKGREQILFDPIEKREQRLELSRTMDMLNHKYSLKTVSCAVEGDALQPWRLKSEHKSPNYLTDINEILTVKI